MNKLLNFIAILLYNLKLRKTLKWSILINLCVLTYAIYDFNMSLDTKGVETLLIIFCLNVLWQTCVTVSEILSITKSSGYYTAGYTVTNDIKIDESLARTHKEITIQELGTKVIINPSLTKLLISDAHIAISTIVSHQKKVERYIYQNQHTLMHFLKCKWHEMAKGAFYNEKKLCMASEIEHYKDGYKVMLSKGCYYNTYLTNEIYNLKLAHQSSMDLLAPLNSTIYPIKPLGDSYFSNHIGVSTLCLTTDGYIILLRHNNRTAIDAKKIHPTASGSSDYKDLNKSQTDFRECIINSTIRELKEETDIPERFIGKTKVIGYYRNISRGGKPEFCCLTNLLGNRYEIKEHINPLGNEAVNEVIDIPILRNGSFCEENINHLISNPQEISVSFYMNYYFLQQYLLTKPAEII